MFAPSTETLTVWSVSILLPQNMKPVKIRWRDSRRYMYQMDADDPTSVCEVETVGFLVRKEKNAYVLAQDDIEGDIRGVITIPKENVLKVTFLHTYTKKS